MSARNQPIDPIYDSLASPLNHAGPVLESSQEALLKEEAEVLEGTTFKRRGRTSPRRCTQLITVGDLTIIAGKTTPVLSSNSSPNFSCFMAMPFIGGFTTKDVGVYDEVCAGDLYLNQNYFGTSTIGYLSSLFFSLDHQRLDRTMRSISGSQSCASLGTSLVVKKQSRIGKGFGASRLWSLITFIDQLYGEQAHMPSCLGLDEQFYRLLSLCLLESAGRIESVHQRWSKGPSSWASPLDELVDFIRSNAHFNLTLTDLEERSHYSARHLQNLFKERFGCTPMQFVRRQRLSTAMEKLQSADWTQSVGTIARDCGYRHLSNFTHDFQAEFGVKPSTVLRSARGV